MGSRTKARARVLQVLYAWEIRGGAEPLRQVDLEITAPERPPLDAPVREYANQLLDILEEAHPQVDARIEALSDNWRLSRMTTIDRNILRIAAAEMLHIEDVPLKVSLQEAILLAEWFGTDESRRFVNGVLDALLRELEPEQTSGTR
jgi:N utilization substance protein B